MVMKTDSGFCKACYADTLQQVACSWLHFWNAVGVTYQNQLSSHSCVRPAARSPVSGLGGQPCVGDSNPLRRESAGKGVEPLPLQPADARGNRPEGCGAGEGRFALARSQNCFTEQRQNYNMLVTTLEPGAANEANFPLAFNNVLVFSSDIAQNWG